jgi:chemotaxis family two-component system response regulator Rcp1
MTAALNSDRPARIFVAEDNKADVWLIEEALRRQSLPFQLDHHLTAAEAIAAVKDCGVGDSPVPDLLLLDYNLPGGQGLEILIAAAENPNLAGVPKAILSSFLRPNELQDVINMGASCFIPKPASLAEFLRDVGTKVVDLLNAASAAQENPAKPAPR